MSLVLMILFSALAHYLYRQRLNDPTNGIIEFLLYLMLIMIATIIFKVLIVVG